MKKSPKIPKTFCCKSCDYSTSNIKDYNKHVLTAKHRNRTILNDFSPKNAEYFCECGKRYNARNSLWYHKKKCTFKNETTDVNYKDILIDTLQQHTEAMKQQQDTIEQLIPSINGNVNNINSNNTNNFNINIFLNEHCKDAMNITDFIESIQLSIEDMTQIGIEGQTKGMSNILIDKLNSLDVSKRPMHCSDIKKETIYIKDEGEWEKESNDRSKLVNAIDKLAVKSIKSLDYMDNDPEAYVQTANEVLKDPREDKKIISSVAKEIYLSNNNVK
jgi:hypothetical protein